MFFAIVPPAPDLILAVDQQIGQLFLIAPESVVHPKPLNQVHRLPGKHAVLL